MKKMISLVLALAMVLSLAVPAMAAEDTRTIYFEDTDNWSTVNAYAWGAESFALLGTWPGSAMTKVEGEENIYSIEVPTDAVNMIFNNGSEQTADLTIPTDGKNLYTYNSGWSTYGSTGDEPTISGNTSGNVSGIYNPTISITDVTVAGEGISYDPDSDTYTVTIPAGKTSVDVPVVVSGKNLEYASADDTHDVILFSSEYPWYDNKDMFTRNESDGTWIWEIPVDSSMLDEDYVVGYRNPGTNMVTHNVKIQQAYSITLNTAENGTVTADKAAAVAGETVELFVEPADGYELETLTVMQGETAVEVAEDHTFVMPAGDVTVTAAFREETETYTVTVNGSITNGTVRADKTTGVTKGETVKLTVTPAEGYKLTNLTVTNTATGEPVTVRENNTFVMPDGNVTVTATFKATYTIRPAFEGKGAVSADKTSAAEGETVTVTFTPDAGYVLFKRYACDPNNGTNTVELKQVDVSTYTFTMPAHNVSAMGVFVKDGKAREDLYFNNNGITDWTNVSASFYTDTGHFIDSVSLTMAEDGVYTLPEDAEIPNLAYIVYFGSNTEMTEIVDIPTGENNMFTLGTTTDEYDRYEGTWSVYTPSTPEDVTSASISWGSMSFTYTDGEDGAEGAWSADTTEGAGTVTVENTGTTTVTVSAVYTPETAYAEITGTLGEEKTLAAAEKGTFTLTLSGKPNKAIPAGTKIGSVTVTIEAAN